MLRRADRGPFVIAAAVLVAAIMISAALVFGGGGEDSEGLDSPATPSVGRPSPSAADEAALAACAAFRDFYARATKGDVPEKTQRNELSSIARQGVNSSLPPLSEAARQLQRSLRGDDFSRVIQAGLALGSACQAVVGLNPFTPDPAAS